MVHGAAWGVGRGLDGREAARGAIQQALDRLGTARPSLAIAFVSQEFSISDTLTGISSLLTNTPIWGFSTVRPITADGEQARSVVLAVFSGSELKAQVDWWPGFAQDCAGTAKQLVQAIRSETLLPQGLLLVADGINGDASQLCSGLAEVTLPIAGCLAAGDYHLGKTYQLASNQFGVGALSSIIFGGRFRIGIGFGHGWQDIGVNFKVTRVRDIWVNSLDGLPAAEAYSRIFGYPPRDWAFPPLTDLVRLYPLGIEIVPGSTDVVIRSPLHVEVDGSFRMNAPVAENQVAHVMVGDINACLMNVKEAINQARQSLGKARILSAVILVDLAWQFLFETRFDEVTAILRSALGEVPIVGAYTLGQIARPLEGAPPALYNQNLMAVLIGEAEG